MIKILGEIDPAILKALLWLMRVLNFLLTLAEKYSYLGAWIWFQFQKVLVFSQGFRLKLFSSSIDTKIFHCIVFFAVPTPAGRLPAYCGRLTWTFLQWIILFLLVWYNEAESSVAACMNNMKNLKIWCVMKSSPFINRSDVPKIWENWGKLSKSFKGFAWAVLTMGTEEFRRVFLIAGTNNYYPEEPANFSTWNSAKATAICHFFWEYL